MGIYYVGDKFRQFLSITAIILRILRLISRKTTNFANPEQSTHLNMAILNNILACVQNDTIKNYVLGMSNEHPDNFGAHYNNFYTIFPDLANWSFIAGIGITIAVTCLLILGSSKRLFKVRSTLLGGSFLIVFVYGFFVYDIGMCTGDKISLLTNIPMALLYAFKIFLFDSDVSEIHEAYHGSWTYSFNFALVHLLAACVSTLFVIKYFGFNIIAKWRMRKVSLFKKDVDETYVFWGLNDASEKLIGSIKEHYSNPKVTTTYRIVLVRLFNGEDDNPETRTGIKRIFDFLSIPTSELEKLLMLKCLTVGTYSNVSEVNAKEDDDVLGLSLSLRSLKRILEKRTRSKIHMFFLGDNDKENIHAVSLLLKDKSLKDFANGTNTNDESDSKREVVFYCHARYNSVHRVIEDRYMAGNMRVKVIDSSHISVENLKLNVDLLPVKYVKVEKDATVSTPFNSLVIGFSEFGQDIVRFLYEYGAFVKSGSTDTDVKRSEFRVRVVDKRMDDVAGPFVANAPDIIVSAPFITSIKGMDNPDALITLDKMDCQSIEFYKGLETWIKDLNYIVIATEDDELNISIAIRIFKMAARYREDMKNLCILTRVHEDEDGLIGETAEYYNRLWSAQCAIKEYKGKISTQSTVKRGDKATMPIHLFGFDKETYTYKNIIDESMEQQAVEFKERYTASTQKDYKEPARKEDYAWYKDIRDNILCIEGDPNNNPTLSAIMGIRRMQGQDYANCFHSATKIILAQEALKKAGLPKDFSWNLLTRKFKTVEYMVKDGAVVVPQVFRILNVLAQTEHLRWNASHEILGYRKQGTIPSRNEVKMHHSCITDWQELTPDIQSFDYDFVDLILDIISPERPQESND